MAGHLAGGVQAGNGGVGVVEDLRVGVDMQTAHGVVHGRLVGHQVVGTALDGVEVAAEVEVGVVAVLAVLVPLLHGLRQFGGVHAKGLAHGFKRVALYDDLARLKVLVLVLVRDQQTGLVGVRLVEQHVRLAVGLLDDGVGQHVATVQLLDEAVAFLVHHDGTAFEAHVSHVQERTGFGVAHGVRLDVLHVDEVRARSLAHGDAVARGSHRVGGQDGVVHGRVVLHAHVDVRAEAAACQHHGLARDGGLLAGHRVLHLHAGDGVAAFHQFDGGGVLCQRQRVDLSGALRQLRGHLAAAVRDGDDGALRVVAAELHEVVLPRDAAFEGEPLRAVQRTFGDDLHEGGIACVVAAFQHVLRQRVGAVGDAFLHLDPVARRGHLAA